MEEALNRKKEVLPELKEAYKRAKDRAKEAQAAMEQQDKLKGLQDLRVWSYVEEMEEVGFRFLLLSFSFLRRLTRVDEEEM